MVPPYDGKDPECFTSRTFDEYQIHPLRDVLEHFIIIPSLNV